MHKDFQVDSFDGMKLFCRTWSAEGKPKARILFLHGFSEYVEFYDNWFAHATSAGYEITSYDQRGFGRTAKAINGEGKSNEKGVMGDLEVMVDYVSKDYDGPLGLWGFSMGGATCLNYMVIGRRKERFDFYIAVGPEVEVAKHTRSGLAGLKIKLLPYLVKVLPNYSEVAPLTPQMATNNPIYWEQYPLQPLRSLRTTAEYMNDAINRGKRLLDPNFIQNIVDKPLLVCHGLGDLICDPDSTKEFFDMAKLTDKTIELYPDLPHELPHNLDEDALKHWEDVREWIDRHLNNIQR